MSQIVCQAVTILTKLSARPGLSCMGITPLQCLTNYLPYVLLFLVVSLDRNPANSCPACLSLASRGFLTVSPLVLQIDQ